VQSIDQVYVDGISITLGSPHKHVWTYAVSHSDNHYAGQSNCPCAPVPGTSSPAFVKDDYYCESGTTGPAIHANFYLSDPLWDGHGCPANSGCCAQMGMPGSIEKHLNHQVKILKCAYAKVNHIVMKM